MSVEGGLRVLAVTLRYPPYSAGGYELLTQDAIEGLRERGHDVTVLAGRGARFEGTDVLGWLEPELDGEVDPFQRSFDVSNAERFRLHFFRLNNYRATTRAIRDVRPDVVLFFNLSLVSLAPVLAARHLGVATLGYVADPWPCNHWLVAWREASQAPGSPGAKQRRLEALTRFWHGFRSTVDLGPVCVCSRFLRRALMDDGLARDTLSVLPLGLPPDVERATRDVAPAPRRPGEPLRVVCTSSLWKGKGQDVLLEGLALARERGAPIELSLAGAGTDGFREELVERSHLLGLDGVVRFEGVLPRDELGALLRRSHVLAMPSTWGEPFGLATIEGMAFGLAVVATDAGASPELVDSGVDGLVVPAGDAGQLAEALERLEGDEDLRLGLALGGVTTASRDHAHARFLDGLERELECVRARAWSAAP